MQNDEHQSEYDDPHEDARTRLMQWNKDLENHWGDWVKEARECFRMVAGNQWDSDDKASLEDQKKVPVVFNRIGPVIDAVCGAEILGRQEVKYFPRNIGDSGVNEVLSEGAEWIRDLCDAEGEDSDALRDTFICGMGWTETHLDFEIDPEGRVMIERRDPLSVLCDPSARKGNLMDGRYLRYRNDMPRMDFETLYPDEAGASERSDGTLRTQNADPRRSYSDDEDKAKGPDTVSVDYWQWYELELVYMIPSMDGGDTLEVSAEEFEEFMEAARATGIEEMPHTTRKRRQYYQAVLSGKTFLEAPKPLDHGEFTFKCVTGKRDNETGYWYGLVRPMTDPQKWANNFYSMTLHIIRTNAKGGLVAEEGAMGDQKKFEESWARSDAITVVEDGALSSGKIQPKTAPPIPAAFPQMFEQAVVAIRDTTGVNNELMGLVDHNQPGVLEHQRKQAAFGILATFFESFRRYRKFQGELLLKFMQDLPPDTLIRIIGEEDGQAQYIPLLQAMGETRKYDVIVDDAPSGPNQKQQTWQLFTQMLPVVGDLMTPEMWSEVLRFSPFPESFANKMREMIQQGLEEGQSENEKIMEQMQMIMVQLGIEDKQADVRGKNAKATQTEVETFIASQNPDPTPQMVT